MSSTLKLSAKSAVLFRIVMTIVLGVATLGISSAPSVARAAVGIPGTGGGIQAQMRTSIRSALSASPNSLAPAPGVPTFTGNYYLSVDGVGENTGSGTILVHKPSAAATVAAAYMAAATTGFTSYQLQAGDISLDGSAVSFTTQIPNSINSFNYFTDITSMVQAKLNAAPAGDVSFTVGENNTFSIEGEIVAVVFNDPGQAIPNSIVLYFGAQQTTGDTFNIGFGRAVHPADTLDMSLGISYGCQAPGGYCAGIQYSEINVANQPITSSTQGARLTTSAGGEDDGASENGALLTVGDLGVPSKGDSDANPPDPYALPTGPRSDDELYNLAPVLPDGSTSASIYTLNPSNDDNIFFAAFELQNVAASVTNPPTWVSPTPLDKQVFDVRLGSSQTFTMEAQATQGSVTISESSLPNGVTCTNRTNPGDPAQVDCTVAPTTTGFSTITFDARLADGTSAGPRTYTIGSGRYVALGDSYSAGEGNPPFIFPTDTCIGLTSTCSPLVSEPDDQCHRSTASYAYLLGNLTPDNFWACSGARVEDFFKSNHTITSKSSYDLSEVAQLNHITGDTTLVTLTIGGNDVGFSDIAHVCYDTVPNPLGTTKCRGIEDPLVQYVINDLLKVSGSGSSLDDLFAHIRSSLTAPNARTIVLGYPRIFPTSYPPSCQWFSAEDQKWINGVIFELDNVIKTSAEAHGAAYVQQSYDAFNGHELCTSDPWLNGLDPLHVVYSFHPNASGQEALFGILNTQINNGPPGQQTSIAQNQNLTSTSSIALGQAQATFSTSWPGSDVVMSLTSPSGRTIDRTTQAADVVHQLGPTYEVYTVTNPEPGNWTVHLFGADVGIDGEPVNLQVTQDAPIIPPPTASFTVSPTGGFVPLQIQFDASASTAPAGSITNYAWDFGDGTTGSGATLSHTYTQPGTYTPLLTVTDTAGDLGYSSTAPITVGGDTTPPTTVATATLGSTTNPYTFATWTNQPVQVTLNATDNPGGSGVAHTYYAVDNPACTPTALASCTVYGGSPFAVSAEGNHELTYFSVDVAGNAETAHTAAIQIDMTPPNPPTASVNPAPNSAGWNNSPATVSFTSNGDAGAVAGQSGVVSCTGPTTISSDTAGTAVSGACTDAAGNTSAATSVTVKLDTTASHSTATLLPAPNAAGWNKGPVQVTLNATDAGSGVQGLLYGASGAQTITNTTVAGGTATLNITKEGQTTVSYAATDVAGNTEATEATIVKIDHTAPSCALTGTGVNGSGQKYIQITVRDGGSGLASVATTTLNNATMPVNFTVGTTSPLVLTATKINQSQGAQVGLQVTDQAGNVTNCDPVLTDLIRDSGKPSTITATRIAQGEHLLHIYNGDPGLSHLIVRVNGIKVQERDLEPNEQRTVDIGSALQPGDHNTVTVGARGKQRGEATLVIADS